MIWHQAQLLGLHQTDTDALGNPVGELVVLHEFPARLTAWTAQEHRSLGRGFTSAHRKLIAPMSAKALFETDSGSDEPESMRNPARFLPKRLRICGEEYVVTEIREYEDIWTVMVLK